MSVTLWIEFDPGNKVHSDFYKTYEGDGVISPRVVLVVSGETKQPGIYEALWDGRDQTSDHRILLAGTYKVRIQGLHDVVRVDQVTIKIKPPFAHNYGIHYPRNTSKKEVGHAEVKQQALKDGTAFLSDSSCSTPALKAWKFIRNAAIGVVAGHSGPSALHFYPEENRPGKAVAFKRKKGSVILSRDKPHPPPAVPKADIDNSVFLPEEPRNALRDVFLMVLAGCRAGNEVWLIQVRLKQLSEAFDPSGVDGKHGPKTTKALAKWQAWEHVEPVDGTKNPATLARLRVDPALDEGEQTEQVQQKLTEISIRYNPGEADGVWGSRTEAAITHYQRDHNPPLELTSLPDSPTLKHLHPIGSFGGEVRNIAEAFTILGANLVVGFIKTVSFKGAEKWHMNFWDNVATGLGVTDAAETARMGCGVQMRKELDYKVYNYSLVDKNSTVHPARHGRDMV